MTTPVWTPHRGGNCEACPSTPGRRARWKGPHLPWPGGDLYCGSCKREHEQQPEPAPEPHHPACVKYGDDSGCTPCNR